MNKKVEFTGWTTKDANQFSLNKAPIGQRYRHFKGREYIVSRYVWDGERDLWLVEHFEVGATPTAIHFVRSHDNFFGSVINEFGEKVKRFELVKFVSEFDAVKAPESQVNAVREGHSASD